MSAKRIAALRKQLTAENLDGVVISNGDHLRYLTGYTGSNGLLALGRTQSLFFTDFRYVDQAKKQVRGARCHFSDRGDLLSELADYPRFNRRNLRLGVLEREMTVAERDRLKQALPEVIVVGADRLAAEMGWVKTPDELAAIVKAVKIADIALSRVLGLVVPGVRENELAAELEYQMAMLGSQKPGFETIVASGYRSAMPHGVASRKKVKKGEFVTFDFGATVDGYVSDITRTVVLGKATTRQKKVYSLVLRAQKAGIRKVKAGIKASTVDEACRRIIRNAGHAKNFGHGTGHGIGFIIHTGPSVGPRSEDKLKVNNVITIEPGVYFPGWGGVRIEDDVVVTRTGGRVLNQAEKKLLEL